jgi:hypothetical protein
MIDILLMGPLTDYGTPDLSVESLFRAALEAA